VGVAGVDGGDVKIRRLNKLLGGEVWIPGASVKWDAACPPTEMLSGGVAAAAEFLDRVDTLLRCCGGGGGGARESSS